MSRRTRKRTSGSSFFTLWWWFRIGYNDLIPHKWMIALTIRHRICPRRSANCRQIFKMTSGIVINWQCHQINNSLIIKFGRHRWAWQNNRYLAMKFQEIVYRISLKWKRWRRRKARWHWRSLSKFKMTLRLRCTLQRLHLRSIQGRLLPTPREIIQKWRAARTWIKFTGVSMIECSTPSIQPWVT